ncbi:MAG: alkaline phosphatase [Calditrichaeota bacterium]|nr:MAG: alkaline phosphatase [Calditrichota bacterium]MBL1207316.1 alkaline phosphatase [Calditrichota bacterium]NOG47148.1 alkaline phosphatase [Calditrichota bacterium]
MTKPLLLILFLFFFSCNTSNKEQAPKNIILFIGDGMGLSQISALKTVTGQPNLARFKTVGFLTTHSADEYVTDSAAGATAMATGQKTNNYFVALSPEKKPLKTVIEYAGEKGKATGLVVTSGINHATPASFVAHVDDRWKYNEIARHIADASVDVLIGGRLGNFLPQSHDSSLREDDLDLLGQLQKKMKVVTSVKTFKELTNERTLAYLYSKESPKKAGQRPLTLKEMTKKAIEVLSQNENGFFLMVEGSQIDWGGHDNDHDYIISEIVEFDEAVGSGLDFALKNEETLIIVTADHETGGFALVNGSVEEKIISEAAFTSTHHTGTMVPIFSYGPQAEIFGGIHDNTFVGKKIIEFNR